MDLTLQAVVKVLLVLLFYSSVYSDESLFDSSAISISNSSDDDSVKLSVIDSIKEIAGKDSIQALNPEVNSNFAVYRNSLESQNYLTWRYGNDKYRLTQNVSYEIEYNWAGKTRLQHFRPDGEIIFDSKLPFSVGVEWLPLIYLNQKLDMEPQVGYGVGSLGGGVVFDGFIKTIPWRLSGGVIADGWNRSVSDNLIGTHINVSEVDHGGYFKFAFADLAEPLWAGADLVGVLGVTGRYMKSKLNSNYTSSNGVLYYENIDALLADTVSLFIADTLAYGRVGNIYGYSGSGATIENTPMRLDNSGDVALRISRIGDKFIEPTVDFGFMQESYRYPKMEDSTSFSINKYGFKLGLTYNDTVVSFLSIGGGITVFVGKENNLYDRDLSLDAAEDNLNFLNQKLNDADIFTPSFFQEYNLIFSSNFNIGYRFFVERNRKLYPFSYTGVDRLEVVNGSDYDNQYLSHGVFSLWQFTKNWQLKFTGEFSNALIYYQNKILSINSRSNKKYFLELGVEASDDINFEYSVSVGALAQPQKYLFDELSWSPVASSDRKFFFRASGYQALSSNLALRGSADIQYFDKGYNYSDGYYGVSEKKPEVALLGEVQYSPFNFLNLNIGGESRTIFYYRWDWDSGSYIRGSNSYLVTPYISFNIKNESLLSVDAVVRRYIDKGLGAADDYWDIALTIMRGF